MFAIVTLRESYGAILQIVAGAEKLTPGLNPVPQPHSASSQAKLKKKRISKYQFDSTTSRVIPLTDETASWGQHFRQADLVIEAVFEDLGLKHRVIKQVRQEHGWLGGGVLGSCDGLELGLGLGVGAGKRVGVGDGDEDGDREAGRGPAGLAGGWPCLGLSLRLPTCDPEAQRSRSQSKIAKTNPTQTQT